MDARRYILVQTLGQCVQLTPSAPWLIILSSGLISVRGPLSRFNEIGYHRIGRVVYKSYVRR